MQGGSWEISFVIPIPHLNSLASNEDAVVYVQRVCFFIRLHSIADDSVHPGALTSGRGSRCGPIHLNEVE